MNEKDKYKFFEGIDPDASTIDKITKVFEIESTEIKAAISKVKILLLGSHKDDNLLKLKEKLRVHNCFAFFVKDFKTKEKGLPDNLSSELAIKECDVILAIDCKRPGFATECQIITKDPKAQNKTILFALKSELKYKDLPALTDYHTYFPYIHICKSSDELIENAIYMGLHLAKRKATRTVYLNKDKIKYIE